MLVMAPVVLLVNGFTKGDWLQASLFALSIAVGLTPEMLPMIVTSTLAKGALALSRKKVIVKRLDAIQNFGAMDVLCTDKTGTLTQDRIVLERHTDVRGRPCDAVLDDAWLNSYHQTGLRNLLDVAVLEHGDAQRRAQLAEAFSKVDELPFDFERRRMSVVVAEHGDGHRLVCKGALDEVLAVCDRVRLDGEEFPCTTPCGPTSASTPPASTTRGCGWWRWPCGSSPGTAATTAWRTSRSCCSPATSPSSIPPRRPAAKPCRRCASMACR